MKIVLEPLLGPLCSDFASIAAALADHVHVAIEESVNLAFEPRPTSPASAAVAVDPEFLHKGRQDMYYASFLFEARSGRVAGGDLC
jgi:hypothetical protein